MPKIVLTDYECQHDVLPGVCARCGVPVTRKVVHYFLTPTTWLAALLALPLFYSMLGFPPLAVLILFRAGHRRAIRIPLCPYHRAARMWRDRTRRRVLFPVWTTAVLLVDAWIIAEAALGGSGRAVIALYGIALAVVLVELLVISRDTVFVNQNHRKVIVVGNVHPAFVAAVIEDRARDRVDNPARRGGFGDVRDDYDDGPD